MKLKRNFICFFLFVCLMVTAQKSYTVKGNFKDAGNAKIELVGFETLKDTLLSRTECDNSGNFTFLYPAAYVGAAVLKVNPGAQGEFSLIVLLNSENFSIDWDDSKDFNTLHFENSPQNDAFGKGIVVCQESESKLAGLKYLKPLYAKSPDKSKWVEKEIALEENALPEFSATLPATNYAKYYLGIRKLIQDLPLTANRYIERIPEHEKQFKGIDFSDPRLVHSGLYKELIDGFYQLMESHGDMEKVAEHANAATTAMLKSLNGNAALKKEVAVYLFKLLEKRSLFKSAEFLAVSMLNDGSCTLGDSNKAMFEQYRQMAVGKTAPSLNLTSNVKGIKKVSDIKAGYKLIVFGSSWCPKCGEELPELQKRYQDWINKYNLEIVFVSLDTDKQQFDSFVKDFKFISSCDFKGWESKGAVDYCVFATPTMYLLDSNDKIVLKPFSAAHTESWLSSNAVNK